MGRYCYFVENNWRCVDEEGCVLRLVVNKPTVKKLKVKIIMLTYNAGPRFQNTIDMLLKQKNISNNDILIVDSSSTDSTQEFVRKAGFELIVIPKSEFGHGKTRKMPAEKAGNVDIVTFMTQDTLLFDEDAISNICNYFEKDNKLAAVYGRQIPYTDTDIFGTHARIFNYPEKSCIRSFEDRAKYGIKTAFFSDTFGAYKQTVLESLGSFPDIQFGEDTCMAGKMLINGYKIGYCAEAKVYHSHSFTILEEYERYKDMGKFHRQEKWLIEAFGRTEGEGLRFVKSQINYLLEQGKWYLLPELVIRNGMKYLGYKIR